MRKHRHLWKMIHAVLLASTLWHFTVVRLNAMVASAMIKVATPCFKCASPGQDSKQGGQALPLNSQVLKHRIRTLHWSQDLNCRQETLGLGKLDLARSSPGPREKFEKNIFHPPV